jgi:hypothetical protein
MISDYISIPLFFASFLIGLAYIYIIGPEIETIIVHPSPGNADRIQYKDATSSCFVYKATEVACGGGGEEEGAVVSSL